MSMAEKKSHIIIESDVDSVRLDIEGTKEDCSYMIAHYYISNSEFRLVVNKALESVMRMGINLLKKDMADGD